MALISPRNDDTNNTLWEENNFFLGRRVEPQVGNYIIKNAGFLNANVKRAIPMNSGKKILITSMVILAGISAFSCNKTSITDADDTPGTVRDVDGNVYSTVTIGSQTWTVENLRTTKYNDGSAIPLASDTAAWRKLTTPAYCYYSNTTNADSIKKFGALYNWYVVESGKLAPAGWHVPDTADWNILETYLIANGYNWDGTTTANKIAKSLAAPTDWMTDTDSGSIGNELTKNNTSGFFALPGGCRGRSGNFYSLKNDGYWWSATAFNASDAYDRDLFFNVAYLGEYNYSKSCGLSVRLVKN
jgi:uncharacterized protein (TIGR02145 family)